MMLRLLLSILLLAAMPLPARGLDAQELVERWRKDYREPSHVYEELTLMTTAPRGARSVVTLYAYARREASESRFLWSVATPPAARGMVLFVRLGRDGEAIDARGAGMADDWLFGSVFTVADLIDPIPAGVTFELVGTRVLDRVPHHQLRARLPGLTGSDGTERRLYLRQDNLWLSRLEDVDGTGAVQRRLVFKDPQPDDLGVLRARMALLDDARRGERTLLKVARRVHSADYVPDTVFMNWERRDER